MIEHKSRDQVALEVVTRALVTALTENGGGVPEAKLMREVALTARTFLPDLSASEIRDAILTIWTELQRQVSSSDYEPTRRLH